MMNNEQNERIWLLLARKTANELSPAEAKELDTLLQEYPHALYVQELMSREWTDKYKFYNPEGISVLLQKHKQRLNALTEGYFDGEPVSMPFRKKRIPTVYRALAASIVLAVIAGLAWWMKPLQKEESPLLQQLVTQMGSRSEVSLPDGTKVRLNAGSTLHYPRQFSGKMREVQLEGEGYFDVTKDSSKPFYVHTKAFTVKVVGTEFNVRAYADEDSAVAALIHGSVEVQFDKSRKNVIVLKPNEKLTVAMPAVKTDESTPGTTQRQQVAAQIYVSKALVTTMRDSTIAETAWVENKLAFKNSSFEKIASSLEKWFDAEIRFKSEDKKLLNLTGTFEGESLEEVLHAFQLTGSAFRYKKDSSGVIWIE